MKTKAYYSTHTTCAAEDGNCRTATIAVVLGSDEVSDVVSDVKQVKRKGSETYTKATLMRRTVKFYTLAIGVTFRNPNDEYNQALAEQIALGKAMKESSAVLSFTSKTPFSKSMIECAKNQVTNILDKDVSRFVKVSKKK